MSERDTKHELNSALRQFRHNTDNSPDVYAPAEGFVVAYDKGVIDRLVASLEAEIARLREIAECNDPGAVGLRPGEALAAHEHNEGES